VEIAQDRTQDGAKPTPTSGSLRRLNLSLRWRLILLVLAGVLPITAFGLVDGYLDYRAAVERVGRERQLLARAMAVAVDSELQRSISAVQVLAQSRRLLERDMVGFRRRANDVITEQFPGANILLLAPDGQQIMNTAVASEASLPRRRDLTTLRQALTTGQPVVSDLFYGLVVKRFVISVDVPVRDANGEFWSVVSINPPAAAFADLIGQHRPPGNWVVEVVDRQGVIVARSPDPLRHVGQKTHPALLAAIQAERSGIVELSSRDGAPMLAVFTRGETIGWTVVLGIPHEELTGPAIAAALRTLVIGGIFLALGLALAIVIARRIAEPIGALRTLATKAGGDSAVPPVPTGLRETDDVAAALWASHTQRQHSERRYRTLFDANPHAVCVFDLETRRFLEVNAATVSQYGWTRDELLAMTLHDTHAPDEPSRLRGAIVDLPDTPYLMRHRRKDGTIFDAACVVRIIEYDGRRVGLAMSQDVTDQNLTRAARRSHAGVPRQLPALRSKRTADPRKQQELDPRRCARRDEDRPDDRGDRARGGRRRSRHGGDRPEGGVAARPARPVPPRPDRCRGPHPRRPLAPARRAPYCRWRHHHRAHGHHRAQAGRGAASPVAEDGNPGPARWRPGA